MEHLPTKDDPPEVLCEIAKSKDVIMTVRLMTVQGMKYIEFRDWLRARGTWGRGYWFDYDREDIVELASALLEVAERDD